MVELGQVVQARRHIGMVGAEGLLHDRQRALVERLRLGVLTLGIVERGQVVQARRHIGMIWPNVLLRDLQRLLRDDDGTIIFARAIELHRLLVEDLPLDAGTLGVGRSGRKAQDRDQNYHLYGSDHFVLQMDG